MRIPIRIAGLVFAAALFTVTAGCGEKKGEPAKQADMDAADPSKSPASKGAPKVGAKMPM